MGQASIKFPSSQKLPGMGLPSVQLWLICLVQNVQITLATFRTGKSAYVAA